MPAIWDGPIGNPQRALKKEWDRGVSRYFEMEGSRALRSESELIKRAASERRLAPKAGSSSIWRPIYADRGTGNGWIGR